MTRPDPATPLNDTAPPPLASFDPSAPRPPKWPRKKGRSKQGGCLPWVIAIMVMITGYAVWQFPSFKAEAEVGAAYAARVGCACRYVQGRDIKSCESDFMPGMEFISLTDVPENKSVIGSAPLLASRTAQFSGKSGCILLPQD